MSITETLMSFYINVILNTFSKYFFSLDTDFNFFYLYGRIRPLFAVEHNYSEEYEPYLQWSTTIVASIRALFAVEHNYSSINTIVAVQWSTTIVASIL